MSTNGRDTIEPETSRPLTKEAADLRDHNDEKNGATHKPHRFVAFEDTEDYREEQRLKTLFKNTMTLLQMRLTDPAYRALYEQVEARLAEAEAQLAIAKEQALNDAAHDADKLEDVKSEAVRLPDGRVIFRDKHGKARYDTGALVDPGLLSPDLQRRLAQGPTYEDYQGKAEEARNSTRRVEQIDDIEKKVLIPARREISDPEKPPSMERLEEIDTNLQIYASSIKPLDPNKSAITAAAPKPDVPKNVGNNLDLFGAVP
jgi:hypothetical protein